MGNLLRAWGDAGEAPPAAVVGAIVHDLAEGSQAARRPVPDPDPDAVWIDAEGRAEAEALLTVGALAELLELGLSGVAPGRTGDLMPSAARGGLERFRQWDGAHDDGCAALASWVRTHLGPLPQPEEVARCCRASAPLDPQAATILPTRAPVADPELREALSEAPGAAFTDDAAPLGEPLDDEAADPADPEAEASPEPSAGSAGGSAGAPVEAADGAVADASAPDLEVPEAVSGDSLEPTTIGSAHPAELGAPLSDSPRLAPLPSLDVETPPPPSAEEAAATGSMDLDEVESSGDRPVVRKELPSRRERTVSVVSAPAARRSARPLTDRGDSILVPADSGARGWVLLLLGVGIAVGLYFLLTPA